MYNILDTKAEAHNHRSIAQKMARETAFLIVIYYTRRRRRW